jgi:stage II sporulation protein AA (anti-sigma F factor antagonist)
LTKRLKTPKRKPKKFCGSFREAKEVNFYSVLGLFYLLFRKEFSRLWRIIPIVVSERGIALNIETEKVGRNLFVMIDGELDLETSPTFRNLVEEYLNQDQTIKHLILDMQKVPFIDSSGLGAILGRFKRLSQEGGRLSAINVSVQVKKIFELSGLLKIMDIYNDRKQVLDKVV